MAITALMKVRISLVSQWVPLQNGLPSTTTRSTGSDGSTGSGTQTYTNFYDTMGRLVGAEVGDLSAACTYYNDGRAGRETNDSATRR